MMTSSSSQLSRHAMLALFGGGLLLGSAQSASSDLDAAAEQAPDSVIMIVADDLGVDAMDRYGVGTLGARTPTLDRLADEGVMFSNAWAHPMCSPFRAAALTGRHAFRTGVGDVVTRDTPGLAEDEITIPEALDAQPELGATHAAFGKWHLGNSENGGLQAPNVAGFGHYSGALGNIGEGPPASGPYDYFRWRKVTDGRSLVVENYAGSETVDDAAAWLQGRTEPYFLYLPMHLPHSPYHAPPDDLHSVDLPADAPASGEDAKPYFSAMIEAFDTEVGRLLDGLSADQSARTTVIFVGDNGTGPQVASGPVLRRRAKGTIYQGGLHVPLIIAGPIAAAPGREVDALAGSVDLFGTALELMGAGREAWELSTDSVSLVPFLRDPDQEPLRQWVFSEQFAADSAAEGDGKTIRDERFKYLAFDDGTEELFDLAADPYERVELIAAGPDADAQAALVRLRSELAALLASSLPSTPVAPTPGGTATTPTPGGTTITPTPDGTATTPPDTVTPESPTPQSPTPQSPTPQPGTATPSAMPPSYLPVLYRFP